MKKYTIVILLFFAASESFCQYLTQSADGKSAILLPLNGLGLGIDIGKSEVAIGINNYQKVLKDAARFLIGTNLSVKSSEGLGSLFSKGDIVPQGDFLGLAGFSFSNYKTLRTAFNNSGLKYITDTDNKRQAQLTLSFRDSLISEIRRQQLLSNDTTGFFACTLSHMIDTILTKDGPGLRTYFNNFKPQQPALAVFAKNIKEYFDNLLKIYQVKFQHLSEEVKPLYIKYYNDFMDKLCPKRLTIFLQGGISARSFKRYIGLNITDYNKSFKDTLFRGGIFGIGINAQIRNYWLGVTYSYVSGDNFLSLTSKEYTLRTTDTMRNQALITEKKITAYPGAYGKVETNQLNIDLVGEYKMNDTSRLLVNLYLRGSCFSRDTSLLKNYTNIGAGFYFIGKKSKFLGGLYVELPDVNNNIEKAKPAAEQNIRSPFKRLSFGIVTKFNLSSLMSWANRPAKSD